MRKSKILGCMLILLGLICSIVLPVFLLFYTAPQYPTATAEYPTDPPAVISASPLPTAAETEPPSACISAPDPGFVNLRSSPTDAENNIIMLLKNGQQIKISRGYAGWVSVQANGWGGYVWHEYIGECR